MKYSFNKLSLPGLLLRDRFLTHLFYFLLYYILVYFFKTRQCLVFPLNQIKAFQESINLFIMLVFGEAIFKMVKKLI